MKHNVKITLLIISMFLITQFIGLYVVYKDPFHIQKEINGEKIIINNKILSWINPPKAETSEQSNFYLSSIILSFIFSIFLSLFFIKFKFEHLIKLWFFLVVSLSLLISFIAIFPFKEYSWIFLIPFSISLSYLKIFKRDLLLHNLTELFIYPGIACVFIPLLNLFGIFILLILISIYDIWAVWHSGIMQKMAKFQMNKVKVFGGFFIPYLSKKQFEKLKKLKKQKSKSKKQLKIKTGIAILGGGDVVFPIITSGVVFLTKEFKLPFGIPSFVGGLIPALFVIFGATIGLSLLLFYSEKKKFYPAMPFISAGIFIALIFYYFLNLFL
jgi:presenilin-like A22 family membrane protease